MMSFGQDESVRLVRNARRWRALAQPLDARAATHVLRPAARGVGPERRPRGRPERAHKPGRAARAETRASMLCARNVSTRASISAAVSSSSAMAASSDTPPRRSLASCSKTMEARCSTAARTSRSEPRDVLRDLSCLDHRAERQKGSEQEVEDERDQPELNEHGSALLASSRSVGEQIEYGETGKMLKVQNIEHFDPTGWDFALFAIGSEATKVYAPKFAAAGCTVIEADYYLFEALRRFDGHLPRAGAPP